MWHKYVKVFVFETKTKTKIDGWVLLSHSSSLSRSFLLVCLWQFDVIVEILSCRDCLLLPLWIIVVLCLHASMYVCLCMQMTRWYFSGDAPLTALAMHILNFVPNMEWATFSSFAKRLPFIWLEPCCVGWQRSERTENCCRKKVTENRGSNNKPFK